MGENDKRVKEFDKFFVENYKYLLGFTRSIDVKNDYESLLHDCYVKCKTRLLLSGYSGNSYLNYTRVTIMNSYKTQYRDTKHAVDFDCQDYEEEIEDRLQLKEDLEQQSKQHDYEMVFLNTMAYEYVNKYFNEKENMIFKTYYVLKHKHINYKMLSECTGYSITSVSNTIKKIKKALRINLVSYINTGLNVMELADKIKKVETVVSLPLNENLGLYKSTYIEVFGRPFKSSCSCHMPRIRTDLISWLDKNKPLLK